MGAVCFYSTVINSARPGVIFLKMTTLKFTTKDIYPILAHLVLALEIFTKETRLEKIFVEGGYVVSINTGYLQMV